MNFFNHYEAHQDQIWKEWIKIRLWLKIWERTGPDLEQAVSVHAMACPINSWSGPDELAIWASTVFNSANLDRSDKPLLQSYYFNLKFMFKMVSDGSILF